MKRTVLKYGTIGGALMVVAGWLNFFIMQNASFRAAEIGGYISILIGLSLIYLGIKFYRDQLSGGFITFGRAFNLGVAISLIPSAFMFVSTLIFFALLGDQWLEWALERLPEDQLEQYANAPEYMSSPAFQGLVMFATVLLLGIAVSLASAVLLKKQP